MRIIYVVSCALCALFGSLLMGSAIEPKIAGVIIFLAAMFPVSSSLYQWYRFKRMLQEHIAEHANGPMAFPSFSGGIRHMLDNHSTPLEIGHLRECGWEETVTEGYIEFTEPNIKDRDRIGIRFEQREDGQHYYRVVHGPEQTFIACESTVEWLELYMTLHNREARDPHNPLKLN